MTKYLIIIVVFIVGFSLYIPVINNTATMTIYSFDESELNNYRTGLLFFDIFLNNLIICFFIAFFGYVSGGILTLIVIFWNGYILSMFMKTGYSLMPFSDFLYLSKHIPLELISIFMFANFGLNGFKFYKNLIIKKEIILLNKIEIKNLFIPILLLLISSIIETL